MRFLHPRDDLARILAGAHDDDASDDFATIDIQGAAPKIPAKLYRGHLLEQDRHALANLQRDLLDVGDALDKAGAADHEFHPAFLDGLAADVEVALRHRRHDLVECHIERPHLLRGDLDLVLPDESADAADLGDSRDGVELVANEPILERTQLTEVVAAATGRLRGVDLEVVLIDPSEAGGVWTEFGDDPFGQRPAEVVEAFENALTGEIVVGLVLEDDCEKREPEHRGRPHRLDTRESLEVDGKRVGDLVLDFLRTAARPVGEDDDLILAEIGNRIDRSRENRPHAKSGQNDRHAGHQEPVAQRPLDDRIDHDSGKAVL